MFLQRLKSDKKSHTAPSLYDYSLFIVASLNVVCHVSAAFSRQLFDGAFFSRGAEQDHQLRGHAGRRLLDQARLFDQVRSMAVTDPLTGLANYRRLISVSKPNSTARAALNVLSASCSSIWTDSKPSMTASAI